MLTEIRCGTLTTSSETYMATIWTVNLLMPLSVHTSSIDNIHLHVLHCSSSRRLLHANPLHRLELHAAT
jgi:hypothetical protein